MVEIEAKREAKGVHYFCSSNDAEGAVLVGKINSFCRTSLHVIPH
jgi:hypothetical protein